MSTHIETGQLAQLIKRLFFPACHYFRGDFGNYDGLNDSQFHVGYLTYISSKIFSDSTETEHHNHYIFHFFPHRTLQNINEPSGVTRLLYAARPNEKKARLSRSLTLPLFNFPGANSIIERIQQQPQTLESFKTSSSKYTPSAEQRSSNNLGIIFHETK